MSSAESGRADTAGAKRRDWLRARHIRALIFAALGASLVLGVAVLEVNRPASPQIQAASPMSDEQSEAQVVDAARHVVAVTGLRAQSTGYSLLPCNGRDEPPYQGAVYLTVTLPAGVRAQSYFDVIAAALREDGWTEGVPPNNYALAKAFSRDAVTVIFFRRDDDPGLAVLRIDGACRNTNDHRRDSTTWRDVTDQVTGAG